MSEILTVLAGKTISGFNGGEGRGQCIQIGDDWTLTLREAEFLAGLLRGYTRRFHE